ncbi:hypothetical protein [Enterococcus olivae]
MPERELYLESYQYIESFFEEKILYRKNFFLENLLSLTPKEGRSLQCIDHLPKAMSSKLYFYEFDYDRDSPDQKLRQNYSLYLEKYRRTLLTILGYAECLFIESSFFDYQEESLMKFTGEAIDFQLIDNLLLSSLNERNQTIFSLPELELILQVDSLFVTFLSTNIDTLGMIREIAMVNGLYVHPST